MNGRRAKRQRKEAEGKKQTRLDESLFADPVGQLGVSARPSYTSQLSYIVVPNFPRGHPLHNKSSPVGSAGDYEVTFVLAIPGRDVVQTEVNFEKLLQQGDSLIQVDNDAKAMQFSLFEQPNDEKPMLTADVGINEHHRMQYVRVRVQASSFANAAKMAHDLVMPMLSRWSFQHDVPVTTSGVELHELTTGSRNWTMTIIGVVKMFSDSPGLSTEEGRTLLAAYREGLSTLEPLYQALCMYRVIEGSYVLRNRRRADAVAKLGKFSDPSEVLSLDQIAAPSTRAKLIIEKAFQPYVGKKFTKLRDDFKSEIRHAIAHLDLDADPLAADDYDDLQKIRQALPVMHHMARALLAAELGVNSEEAQK